MMSTAWFPKEMRRTGIPPSNYTLSVVAKLANRCFAAKELLLGFETNQLEKSVVSEPRKQETQDGLQDG